MLLAEEQAHGAGATQIGLNVFGHNTVARRLYEALGYETTAVLMRKELRRQLRGAAVRADPGGGRARLRPSGRCS